MQLGLYSNKTAGIGWWVHSEQNGGGSLVDVGRLAYTREATEEREAGRTRAR